MQPLVCNAVVLKVRKIYMHEPSLHDASVNESSIGDIVKVNVKAD